MFRRMYRWTERKDGEERKEGRKERMEKGRRENERRQSERQTDKQTDRLRRTKVFFFFLFYPSSFLTCPVYGGTLKSLSNLSLNSTFFFHTLSLLLCFSPVRLNLSSLPLFSSMLLSCLSNHHLTYLSFPLSSFFIPPAPPPPPGSDLVLTSLTFALIWP